MDSLLSLWPIFVAGTIIIGIAWYVLRRQPANQKRDSAKQPEQTEPSIDKIATTTRKNLTKARTMEEAFAIGKEGLNKIKRQIKEPKHKQQRKK